MRDSRGVTRRGLGALMAGLAMPRGAVQAQSAAPADELTAARERLAQQVKAIRAVKVATGTEPAFQFKA
jgi:hypothetical protein